MRFERFRVGFIETNCYVIYDSETKKGVLLDPGEYDERIKNYIEKEKLDIQWTINTHGHIDHIKGNKQFRYPVMIHVLDEPFLTYTFLNLSTGSKEETASYSAEELLEDGQIIKIGGIELEVIHTPGHTPGSVSIKCGNILFSGDTLFYEGVGRTDRPGGNQKALISSLRKLFAQLRDETRVFPGHGPETTIGHEKKNNFSRLK